MISSIRIINFKGIKDTKIHFTERITGIYGENGVGKTSVLEVIKLFQSAYCSFYNDEEI